MDCGLVLDYILEQPSIVNGIVQEVQEPGFAQSIAGLIELAPKLPHTLMVGSGSSLNAAYAAKSGWRAVTESLEICDPVNFSLDLDKGLIRPGSIVIGISQSGQSLATVEALKKARNIGARTWAVTAGEESPIGKAADRTILVNCGEERVGPKTKGYSATVAVLIGLAQLLRGDSSDSESVKRIQSYLDKQNVIRDFADQNSGTDLCFVVGSSDNLGTAREGALKIMEIAKIPSMYFDVEDSMHGAFNTVTENSFVVVLGLDGVARERMEGLVKILQRIGAKGCFVSAGRIQSLAGEVDLQHLICDPVADIVPVQLLSYYFALARGVDPIEMSYDRSFVHSITKLAL